MKITIRADTVEVEGYVNAVGRDSRQMADDYGYPYFEQMQPGVFAKALNAKGDEEIQMLMDHDEHHVIGGTGSNLELEEDAIGLHARAVITDAVAVEAAREKKLRGWSFGFIPLDQRDEYSSDGHRVIRTEIDLIEVSLIDDKMVPVYAGTSVHTRANGESQKFMLRAQDDVIYTEVLEERAEPEAPDLSKYESVVSELGAATAL